MAKRPKVLRGSARGCIALLALATACAEGTADRRRDGAVPDGRNPDDAASTLPILEPQPPWFSLAPGARYFEREGIQAPLLLRNVSSPTVEGFTPLFAAASQAGTSAVRLQLSQGFGYQTLGMTSKGGVLSSWAAAWDAVFDEAERQGIAVVPVFTLWGDWNDGTPALGWSHYDANPLASARGGPAASPADLFADTEAQRVWLGWLSTLVARWSSRPNVIAWEIFSELDLASGVTENGARTFLEKAHRVVRDIEPWRPAFASTSDLPLLSGEPWRTLWDSAGNQLVSIHPYAPDLDREASSRVRAVGDWTGKPVFVGESGLDAAPPKGETLSSAPRAAAGLRHAIWAELVSGAASARALYWEDGYAVYYPATGLQFVTQHQDLERQAANWLAGKDFRGRVPVLVHGDPALFGGAMANAERVSGWARNDLLSPPDWSAPPLERARVEVFLPPGSVDSEWVVTTTSPEDGSTAELAGSSRQGLLSFEVEGPFESIAFDAQRGAELAPICPSVDSGACVGPIYALSVNGVGLFADPGCPSARVDFGVSQCRSNRGWSLTSCVLDGVSEPRNCVQLDGIEIGGVRSGEGVYYDDSGALFDVVIDSVSGEIPLAGDELGEDGIRSGTMQGTFSRNGGDGSSQPFELTFSTCLHPLTVCLL